MPYKVVPAEGNWQVRKVLPNGNLGRTLGTHPTKEKAEAQLRALYAREPNLNQTLTDLRELFQAEEDLLAPGKPEGGRVPFFWVVIQPEDQTPYVLSREAVTKNWLPPQGRSALPRATREQIPERLRYWKLSGQAALDARKELAENWEELKGPGG